MLVDLKHIHYFFCKVPSSSIHSTHANHQGKYELEIIALDANSRFNPSNNQIEGEKLNVNTKISKLHTHQIVTCFICFSTRICEMKATKPEYSRGYFATAYAPGKPDINFNVHSGALAVPVVAT